MVFRTNRQYSYSRYWTGTSLPWRLMWGNIIKNRLMSLEFWKDSTHHPQLQASSRPVPRIQILSTDSRLNLVSFGERLNPRLPKTVLLQHYFFFFWDRFSVTMTIVVEKSEYCSEILQQRSCTGTEYLHQLQACLCQEKYTLATVVTVLTSKALLCIFSLYGPFRSTNDHQWRLHHWCVWGRSSYNSLPSTWKASSHHKLVRWKWNFAEHYDKYQ